MNNWKDLKEVSAACLAVRTLLPSLPAGVYSASPGISPADRAGFSVESYGDSAVIAARGDRTSNSNSLAIA
jgi:hypothetical protein